MNWILGIFNIQCEDRLAGKENLQMKKIMTAQKENALISV